MPAHGSATALRTCPDCGGILEPEHPYWVALLDASIASSSDLSRSDRWQCLICGFSDRTVDHEPPDPSD